MTTTVVIEADGLYKAFGRPRAVDGGDLVPRGAVLGEAAALTAIFAPLTVRLSRGKG